MSYPNPNGVVGGGWDKVPYMVLLKIDDIYLSSSGEWVQCPCPGVRNQTFGLWWRRPEQRCPHDGGTCHHGCDNTLVCYRRREGMELTTLHEGFPKPDFVEQLVDGQWKTVKGS